MDEMQALRDYLATLGPGRISETAGVENLLAAAWDQLDGGEAEGMQGYKLVGRMENVTWDPPLLTFVIERHGGTVMGSSRASLHKWVVDVEQRTAAGFESGFRQVRPMASPFHAKPAAEEIANLVLARMTDDRLKWKCDGSVQIAIGKIVPDGGLAKATLAGRRKRFSKQLDGLLEQAGWKKIRTHVYAKG